MGFLDQWHWRNPLPQGGDLTLAMYGLVDGMGTWVFLGPRAAVTTTDFAAYQTRSCAAEEYVHAGVYAEEAGLFVAVGRGGLIKTSPDGLTWTRRDSGTTADLWGITFVVWSHGFIAVGSAGTILRSPDGVLWTEEPLGRSTSLHGVAAGVPSGGLRAVAAVGDGLKIYDSADGGPPWEEIPILRPDWTFTGIRFHSDGFIAFARRTGVYVPGGEIWMMDGTQVWTSRSVAAEPEIMTAGPSLLAAVRPPLDFVLTSVDGWDWVRQPVPAESILGAQLAGIGYGDGRFAAVGNRGGIFTSEDGTAWTEQTQWSPAGSTGSAAYGGGQFALIGQLFVGDTLETWIYGSPDGSRWSPVTSLPVRRIFYANGQFIAAGGEGRLFTSPDVNDWTEMTTNLHAARRIVYGNGRYVAVGSPEPNQPTGGLAVSDDLATWAFFTPGRERPFSDVVFSPERGLFAAVGDAGVIDTSADGETWVSQHSGTVSTLRSITYGSGHFVAVGGTGEAVITTSADGSDWTVRTIPAADLWPESVAWGGGWFVAGGSFSGGRIITSPDGIAWTVRRTPAHATAAVIFGDERFLIVDGPALLQSDPVSPAGAPQIELATGAIAFPATAAGSATEESLTVSNPGETPLTIEAVSDPGPPFAVVTPDLPGRTLNPGESLTVTVQFAPWLGGIYQAQFAIQSNDPATPRAPVTVAGEAFVEPAVLITAVKEQLAGGSLTDKAAIQEILGQLKGS